MTVGEFLASVLQPYIDLLPTIESRPATNEWLVVDGIFRGPCVTRLPVVYIPTLVHVERYPMAEHPIDVGMQSLMTADGKKLTANATVIVTVEDPILLREHVSSESWEEWVSMIVRGSVREVLSGHNWSQIVEKSEDFILNNALDRLSRAGVGVEQLILEDLTETASFRLFSHVPEV